MAPSSTLDVWETIALEAERESPLWGAALKPELEREPVFSPLAEERFALGIEPKRVAPERRLRRGIVGDRAPHHSEKEATASIVRSISSSPCASETNIASNCEGAT